MFNMKYIKYLIVFLVAVAFSSPIWASALIALPTNQGGTGLSSPGTSGNVLTSDGTIWTSAPATGGGSSATTSLGSTITTVSFIASPQTAQTWTNMPATETEIFNATSSIANNYTRQRIDLTRGETFQLTGRQAVAGTAGATMKMQCSADQTTWTDAGASSADIGIGTLGTQPRVGNLASLNSACKGYVYLRLVGTGGNAVNDPSWRNLKADVYLTRPSVGGTSTSTTEVAIAAIPQTAQTWTNMPAALTELFGATNARFFRDTTNATGYRLYVNQAVAGFAGADLNLQCSADNVTFIAADTGSAGEVDVGTGTGLKNGNEVDLVPGCIGSLYWRLVGKQGNGVVDPSFRQIKVQFTYEEDASGGSSQWLDGLADSIYYLLGNVGIGTSTPQAKLHVDGDVRFQGENFATTTIGDFVNNITIGAIDFSGGKIPFLRSITENAGALLVNKGAFYIQEDAETNGPATLGFISDDLNTSAGITFSTTTGALDISSQATTTANEGFDISNGCYAVDGVCITGGGGDSLWEYSDPFVTLSSSSPILSVGWPYYSLSDTIAGLFLGSGDGSVNSVIGFNVGSDAMDFRDASGGYTFDAPILNSGTGTSTFAGGISIANGQSLQVSNIFGYSPITVGADLNLPTNVLQAQSVVISNGGADFYNASEANFYSDGGSTLLGRLFYPSGRILSIGTGPEYVNLDTTAISGGEKNVAFQNESGTVALLSDIPAEYATTSVDYWLTTKSTTDLAEGSNLYWTDTRFDNRLSATTSLPNITTLGGLSLPIGQVSGLGTGVATFLATPSSANLDTAVTDDTGSGALVFATSPTLVTPILGTPTSVTLTNATGLPVSTGISGLGTGVATFLATPSSANLDTAVTDDTGSGLLVFATSPVLTTPNLGTPSAVTLTNGTGLPIVAGTTGTLSVARGGTNLTASADDNTMIGNGTTWQTKALTDCNGASDAVTYDTATNAWGCNSIGASGGGWTDDGSFVRLTTASDNIGAGSATSTHAKMTVSDSSNQDTVLNIKSSGINDSARIEFNNSSSTLWSTAEGNFYLENTWLTGDATGNMQMWYGGLAGQNLMTWDYEGCGLGCGFSRVGINTQTPGAMLHIVRDDSDGDTEANIELDSNSATGEPFITFSQNGTAKATIRYEDTSDVLQFGTTGEFFVSTGFATPASERFSIDASGNTVFNEVAADANFRIESDTDIDMFILDAGLNRVGISTSTPFKTFSVDGTMAINPGALTTNTGASTYSLCLASGGEVTKNTDAETCIASSERFKKNIENLQGGLSDVLKLQAVTFEMKDESNPGKKIGLIAEATQKVNPLLVSLDEQGKPNGIKWSHITTLLIESVQDQQKQIDNLKLGVVEAKRSAEENWQWLALALLALIVGFQQLQINRLKK